MCQSTVSKVVSRVVLEMERKLCPEFIRFAPHDSFSCKDWFVEKYKIPGVIGCVDGTHIGLQKPTADEHMYLNRKGYHSINAMIQSTANTVVQLMIPSFGNIPTREGF
ncbi:putative nuclease HARBI1 [Rhagoletis pomonella]|uniref:putative nuclease HARBI1 n=1 Tax=Rhagoletis pomonella TaxID=28610 RepID=UPI00178257D3|nr:putative nuclease HARBI1 [Rhagoletis pomonella]